MKICIVTVFDSINCGSYWQAFALGETLKKKNHQVTYLERRKHLGFSSAAIKRAKKTLGYLLIKGPKTTRKLLDGFQAFKKAQENFETVKLNRCQDIDCFVLGSDTIWNLDEKYFSNNTDIYWGERFFPKKVLTYAASAANTSLEQIQKRLTLQNAIKGWTAISVRDQHTQSLIQSYADKPVWIVCDPTLLLSKEDYKPFIKDRIEPSRYIFLYLFKPLADKQAADIKQFAKEHKLRIINGASAQKPRYCDSSAVVSPENFLNYMYYADYIVTDTYHGTIFATNFNRSFVAIDRGKNKVNEFMYNIGMDSQLIPEDKMIAADICSLIDYPSINMQLEEIRTHSLAFLDESLGGVSGGSKK